jgi:hypothetical protein
MIYEDRKQSFIKSMESDFKKFVTSQLSPKQKVQLKHIEQNPVRDVYKLNRKSRSKVSI